jgi:hypothetical protein
MPLSIQDLRAFSRNSPGSPEQKRETADALLDAGKEHGFLYVKCDPFIRLEDVDAMFEVGKTFL